MSKHSGIYPSKTLPPPLAMVTATATLLPNELWLSIFTHIDDIPTIKNVLLTSQHFHALGLDATLRNLVWRTPEKTHKRLADLLHCPEKRRLPRELFMALGTGTAPNSTLVDWDAPATSIPDLQEAMRIRCLGTLANLRSLTITGGTILPHYFDALRQLRRLDLLRLQHCGVFICAPADDLSLGLGEPDLTITSLALHNVVLCTDSNSDPAADTTTHLWQRVRDFEVFSTIDANLFVETQAAHLLPHLPALERLRVWGLPTVGPGDTPVHAWVPLDPAPLGGVAPTLRAFSGTRRMALEIIPQAPSLEEICLQEEISAARALELVESLNPETMRKVEIPLRDWDASVLQRTAQMLPKLESLSLLYRFGDLSSEYLTNTLPSLLAYLPALRIIRICPFDDLGAYARVHPILRSRYRFRTYDDYMFALLAWRTVSASGQRRPTPIPDSEALRYADIWGRANAALGTVVLGPRKECVRSAEGGWVVKDADEWDV
ncbi:hypothetical protein MKEN_01381800 [Mycena kentingensis (nom. inval.)]|nr:hypothetical protein MKEN_01381800 [Mycena kentingensis (nom. inval.)]